MRKILNYILTLAVLSVTLSCEDDLEPKIYGSIYDEVAFKTEADLDAAVTAIYYEMRKGGWGPYVFSDGSSFVMDLVSTDEWTTKWSWNDFLSGNWNLNDGKTSDFYKWTTVTATRCTYFMAKFDLSPVSEDRKKLYSAELRALRAFIMYDNYRLYGPMPFVVTKEEAFLPDPNYKPSRPSREWYVDFVAKELRAAADILPIEQNQYGKVTKGAALHYLLKLNMHEKKWQEALNVANEIIGFNYYALEKDYSKIFSVDNKRNREVIFCVRGDARDIYGNHVFANILPSDYASPHGNSVEGWNGHRMRWEFYDTFHQKDLRRNLIQTTYKNKSGAMVNLRESDDVGPLPLKYGIDPNAIGIWAGNDKILDRFAEVLLFKAEALNELNGPNSESVNLINEIRGRAFGDGVSYPGQNLYNDNFETSKVEANGANMKVGIVELNNYDIANGAAWNAEIDNNQIFGTGKSLKFNITGVHSSISNWAFQYRADKFPTTASREYQVSFVIKSDKDMEFTLAGQEGFRFESNYKLKANETMDIKINAGAGKKEGNVGRVIIMFGLAPINSQIWIDDFKVEMLPKDGVQTAYGVKLSDFPDKAAMREHILAERGWELWYEGKRRDDLIRMDKYIEVGKKYSSNFSEKNLLFQIPMDVRIENPNIEPNPGY